MLSDAVDSACYSFWSEAFQLPIKSLKSGGVVFSSSGRYLARVPGRFYAFFDELYDTCVFVASSEQIESFRAAYTEEDIRRFGATSLGESDFLAGRKRLYNDVDHYIPVQDSFAVLSHSFGLLDVHDEQQLVEFYADCSEDDVDTLDLELPEDVALAAVSNGEIVGVTAYRVSSGGLLADITVLIREKYRGQGLSAPLVSALVERIYARGLIPHYRAGFQHARSLAIAQRLGFRRTQQIIVWDERNS